VNRKKLNTFYAIALAVLFAAPVMLGAPADQPKVTMASLEASKSIGSRQAPIVMEVYADFECPQCRNFFLTTTRQVIDNYVSTGKVYIIHRDFPLSMHMYSRQAARWANAAAVAGPSIFEAVETALYSKQDDWGATGRIEPVLAAALSPADMKKVHAIEASEGATIDAAIAHDLALGQMHNVNATPSIFVMHAGQTTPLPPGGVGYPLLKQYFDYLLQQKK
jgi:protein-disulfide isomerase